MPNACYTAVMHRVLAFPITPKYPGKQLPHVFAVSLHGARFKEAHAATMAPIGASVNVHTAEEASYVKFPQMPELDPLQSTLRQEVSPTPSAQYKRALPT
jgi:hypothetical protein